MNRLFYLFLSLLVIIKFSLAQDSLVQQEWVKHLSGPDSIEYGTCFIKSDNLGYVYVLNWGYSIEKKDDIQLAKISPDGELLWLFRYDSTAYDIATDIAIDDSNNVIICGLTSSEFLFLTIKFSPKGSILWENKFQANGDITSNPQITVDRINNIYVTGYGDKKIITIKYNPDGEILWTNIYESGGNAVPHGIVLDQSYNVYIITSGLIKINFSGNFQWYRKFMDEDSIWGSAMSVAIGTSGNIYTAGSVKPLNSYFNDILTMKFNSNGQILWAKKFNGPADFEDHGHVITVDDSENVYVAGKTSGIGTQDDLTLIKYDSSGNELWVRYYDGPAHNLDLGFGIDIDNNNNIYVAGISGGTENSGDIITIKYDNNGNLMWKQIYSKGIDTHDFLSSRKGITIDPFNNVYVAGNSSSVPIKWYIISIIKYKQTFTDVHKPDENIPIQIKLHQNYPNPFNNTTQIPLSLHKNALISLYLYNIEGKKIKAIYDGFLRQGNHEIELDCGSIASGIYIYRLMSKTNQEIYNQSRKLLILK